MDKGLKIAVILTAIDKMSKVIGDAVNKSVKHMDHLSARSNKIADGAMGFGRKGLLIGAAMAAPLIYATKKAMDFEDKMADVAKAFQIKVGSDAFIQQGESAKRLSEYMHRSAEDAAGLMAALGQGGVAQRDLEKVSKAAASVSVAFDMPAELAAERYTKLKNALGKSWDETKKVSDAINYLSDRDASKASQILDFMAAGGAGIARATGASGEAIAAVGSHLISVGKSGEEAATIMERFYKGLMRNEQSRLLFQKSGSGVPGFLAVLKKGASIKDDTAQFNFFRQFGEYGNDIRLMSKNFADLEKNIKSVASPASYLDSVLKEMANRQSTSKEKLLGAWVKFSNVIIDFGNAGLPILTDFLTAVTPIIKTIGDWVRLNPGWASGIFKVVGGVAALSMGVGALSFATGGTFKMLGFFFNLFSGGFNLISKFSFAIFKLRYVFVNYLSPAVSIATKAMWGFAASLFANPITWIVIGIAALVVGFVLLYQKCDKFRASVDGVIAAGKILLDLFIGVGKVLFGAFTFNPKMFADGVTQAANSAKNILNGGLVTSFNTAYDASMKASAVAKQNEKLKGPEAKTTGLEIPNFGSSSAGPSDAGSAGTGSVVFSPTINLNGGATVGDANKIVMSLKTEFDKLMRQYERERKRVAY